MYTHDRPGSPSQNRPIPGDTCGQVHLPWALCADRELASQVCGLSPYPCFCGLLHLRVRGGGRGLQGARAHLAAAVTARHALPEDARGRCGLAVSPAGGSRSRRALRRGWVAGSSSRPRACPRASARAPGSGWWWRGWKDGAQNSPGHGRGCYSRPGRAVLAACPAGLGLGRGGPVGAFTNHFSSGGRRACLRDHGGPLSPEVRRPWG